MSSTTGSTPLAKNAKRVSHHLDFPVVGIGASAGGLQALQRFFEQMPSDNGMAFVVILHLSPQHESNADKILQRSTRMPVTQVSHPLAIEKNHVYVISPALNLSMSDGRLMVSQSGPLRGRHVAIDLFFRTLADAHQERAYCIIMTGTGADGSVGLARIKEQGGLTLAQTPEDAEYDEMPRNAIDTGQVDIVLPVAEMPQKLLDIWTNARAIWLPLDIAEEVQVNPPLNTDEATAAEQALADIIALLHSRSDHDFKHYKRATVLRRIERRLQVNGLSDLPAYRDYLQAHDAEIPALLDDLLIGVTHFFRDREAFEALEREVMPQLFSPGSPENREVRVWSAGCSTGEEPYSLAMLLCEQAKLGGQSCKIQVFATDINEQAIAIGRAGRYPHAIVTDVAPVRLRQFFAQDSAHYRVKKEIREKVLFAVHNLLRDPPFSKLDLVVCRNLLIYLDREVQREVLRVFHFALAPGGYLFLGSSESAEACAELFTPVNKKHRLYQAKSASKQSRGPSLLPANALMPLAPLSPLSPLDLEKPLPRRASFAEIHQRVLEQYAPPSVIVNQEADIVHLSDRAGQFLRYSAGEPSHNLLTLVHPDLRLELRTALFQAIQSGKSVEARRVRLNRDTHSVYINMVLRPFRDTQSDFIMVLFDEVEASLDSERPEPLDAGQGEVIKHLEAELQYTQLQLQDTIEQAQLSTQELKASNEELQAINEELRSITEELETSKEEQQSINEELITVNHELKSKVEETGKLNDDLQNLITSTDIATVFVDRAMRIKWYTPRAASIFNIIPTDTGRSLLDITHHLAYDDLAQDARRTFESLQLIEREVRSHDGHWYIARLVPYRTAEGRTEGAGLTFIDITARREAEERLRTDQERMRLIALSTRDYAILTLDTEGRITSWNRGAELIFGYLEQEALGQSAELIFLPEDRAKGTPQDEMRRAREEGRAEDERWHLRKDGSRIYCSGVVTPLRDSKLQGYAKIARDLTERKRLEVAQEDRLEQTQAASQQKDEFFAVMSHELKHPLNLIQLNAELLARLPAIKAAPMANRATRSIVASVRNQARVIDDLLDLSRLRTGKLQLNRSPVDLNQVLEGFAEVLKVEAEASQLAFEIRLDQQAKPLVVDGDVIRIEQIIWNLSSNALKFTPAGGRISMTLCCDSERGMARLDLADNGQGIAPAVLPTVFDMFSQAAGQHALRHKDGLGIGLALVRQLTEAHGGSVQVESAGQGLGSTFSVWLPLYAHPYVQAAESRPQTQGKLQQLRVLLVDDSADVLEVLRMLLEMEDARVTSADNGAEALRLAGETGFDLILSDVGMPDMDGYALISALRRLPALAQVPAIALTGYASPENIQKALDAGFTRHLSKPVTLEALLAVIEQLDLSGPKAPGLG